MIPPAAERTVTADMLFDLMTRFYSSLRIFLAIDTLFILPDIAGVRIPSPITMQVPTRTRISNAFFLVTPLSSHLFVFAANDCSGKTDLLYVVNSSSVRC